MSDDLSTLSSQIRTLAEDKIPHLRVSRSTLADHTSYFIHLTMDKREEWVNGIFHNSRYAIFSIDPGTSKVELLSKGLGMPKFRKCKYKNAQHLAEKIASYCLSV